VLKSDGGNIINFDQLNFAIGFVNGSANANSNPFGPNGPEIQIQALNAWLGAANGSGNGNVVFGKGLAVNIAALNLEAGLANGAGNANVIIADNPCESDVAVPEGDNLALLRQPPRINCKGADSAVNIQVGNEYFGALNGALNGNNIGTGSALVVQLENFGAGVGNFSGNANVVGDCQITQRDGDFVAAKPEDNYADATLPNKSIIRCRKTGDSSAFIANNQAFGNLNGAGNANVLDAGPKDSSNLVMVNNHLFGDGNASLNGNAVGHNSNAVIVGNNVVGEGSASGNANALGRGDSDADIIGNNVQGVVSLSGNGNSLGGPPDGPLVADAVDGEEAVKRPPAANAYLKNNRIIGSGSGTANGNGGSSRNAVLIDNTAIGDGSISNNGNQILGDCRPKQDDEDADAFAVRIKGCHGNGSAELIHNTVIGDGSLSNNTDVYNDGTFTAKNNQIIGSGSANNVGDEYNNNFIAGDGSGGDAGRYVQGNTVIGDGSGNGYADYASDNVAVGNNAGNNVSGSNNVAMGTNAGNGAGNYDTAVGANATVTSDHSTALGADAVAYLPNQFVMGTQQDTYKASGITSNLSKSRQSGPLEVVTSDATGNLATDGGEIFRRLDENQSGIALAIEIKTL
jgi:hypothetical protein